MITIDEILMKRVKWDELDAATQAEITELHRRINLVRTRYAKAMKVNDGYRRPADTPSNGSATSWHLKGAAIDIDDNDAGDFWKWCLANLDFISSPEVDLYMEDPRWTHGKGSWMHFQTHAPKSGKRIFVPSSAPASAPKLWDGKYDAKYDAKAA